MRKKTYLLGLLLLGVLMGGAGCVSLSGDSAATNGPAGVFVSIDSGENWQQISLWPQADGVKTLSDVSVYRLAEDPQDNKALYWASRAQGLYYSYDNGKSWDHAAPPMDTGYIYSVAVHPTKKCTIFATNGAVLYRTDDCSRSWTPMYPEGNPSDRISTVAFDPFNPSRVLVGKTSGDVLQSLDEGKSWSVPNRLGARVEHIAFDPLQKDLVYLATRDQGLFRSTDAGKTWTDLSEKLKEYTGFKQFRRLYVHPTEKKTVYWISTFGIVYSKDAGETWNQMNLINPPGSANIYAFGINPKNTNEIYYTATINTLSNLYRSVDGGKNWITKKLPSGQMPTALRIHPENGNIVYVGFTIPPKE